MSDICSDGVSSPLVPDDAGCLGFFFRGLECLEAGAKKAHTLVGEKSHDLLGQAASDVLSHLLRLDPDFDVVVVLGPVQETIRAAMAEWVEVHVEDLVRRLAPEGCGVSPSQRCVLLIRRLVLLIGPGLTHFRAAVRHNPLPRLFLMGQSRDALGADMGGTWVAVWPCDR
ncbi:hypothetical protein D1007_27028 [Hordeum vulgare]|nr:hypothetical protein D1007_27028 [Hordeum vulgare]